MRAAEGSPSDDLQFPWLYSCLCLQNRGRFIQEW